MPATDREAHDDLYEQADTLYAAALRHARHAGHTPVGRYFQKFATAIANAAHDNLIYGARIHIEEAEDEAFDRTAADRTAKAG